MQGINLTLDMYSDKTSRDNGDILLNAQRKSSMQELIISLRNLGKVCCNIPTASHHSHRRILFDWCLDNDQRWDY